MPPWMKRVTSENSFYRKIKTFPETIFLECLHRISGTSGSKPASGWKKGRNKLLVKLYQSNHYF
jgi:hypothetical protein